MKSLHAMLIQLEAICGTGELTSWEESFVLSVYNKSKGATNTTTLSEKQVEKISELYSTVLSAYYFGDS